MKDYEMKKSLSIQLVILNLLCIGTLLSLGFTPMVKKGEEYWERQLRLRGKMNLPVEPILQLRYTSCGEAAITMAYNYVYPETKVSEQEVIDFAAHKRYYTERKAPFTSPEDMVKIAENYADTISTGAVNDADEGLELLTRKLTGGTPVIIDILARLYDPESGAHFVVVTGLAIDYKNPNKTKIYFNDPLTGTNRSGYWLGIEGVWNAWQNNGDPGGSGWWMMIHSPKLFSGQTGLPKTYRSPQNTTGELFLY